MIRGQGRPRIFSRQVWLYRSDAVGRRKARAPVILRIDTAAAVHAGVVFYTGNDKVWLANAVPPQFTAPAEVE